MNWKGVVFLHPPSTRSWITLLYMSMHSEKLLYHEPRNVSVGVKSLIIEANLPGLLWRADPNTQATVKMQVQRGGNDIVGSAAVSSVHTNRMTVEGNGLAAGAIAKALIGIDAVGHEQDAWHAASNAVILVVRVPIISVGVPCETEFDCSVHHLLVFGVG